MMMFIVLLLLACFQGLSAVQWTSTYHNTTKICLGRNLMLGWDYSLKPGETVEDIKFLFSHDPEQTPSVVAICAYTKFDPFPSYVNRLTQLNNDKVVLANVTVDDAGNYTTQVITTQTSGSFTTIRRHLVVTVADPSDYRNNVLLVKMDDKAVADNHGNLRVRLTCGPIAWRGEPPVDVMWTTPPGAKLSSTGYKNDYFYLILDNPVVTGVYTCGLPASAIPALCLRAGDPLTTQVTVTVDSTSARLALLEANLQQLKGENFHLTQQLQDVKRNLTQQLQDDKADNLNLTQQLQDVKGDLKQQLHNVKGDLTHQLQQVRTGQNQCRVKVGKNIQRMKSLEHDFSQYRMKVGKNIQRLTSLEHDFSRYRNISSTNVGFHTRLFHNPELRVGQAVKFRRIYYNDGSAYDKNTGLFTAPVDGTYFIIYTVTPPDSEDFSNSELMLDRQTVGLIKNQYYDYYQFATAHAALHIRKGSTVWVKSTGNGHKFFYGSSFSGFLIRADL